MAEFQYRTRGNSSPQGKARVFICGRPQDLETYFDDVASEILDHQDCAVFYAPAGTEYELSDLSQAQLFVVLVTSHLLSCQNYVLDVLIPYALSVHIPILPLMMENGLEETFNRLCGDLQLLNRDNRDATAISYEEKLNQFLNSVLIGNEQTDRIRAAFDCYIFLSYRKKDRKYAQELMRLVHKNDFCRDCAIWYDEFLTPGENFNNIIQNALSKSDLFLLAVTPNLVNEDNYVMAEEYPRATDAGKVILAAELQSTDKALLSDKYPNIPPCVDAWDEDALRSALREAFEKMPAHRKDNSVEHQFLMGLAYLGGIDVEKNTELAKALITEAAENDLPEAIERLAAMYHFGDGVQRDYHEEIRWLQKRADLAEADLMAHLCVDTIGEYYRCMNDLACAWQDLGVSEKADEVFEKKLQLSLHLTYDHQNPHCALLIAQDLNNLANVRRAQGNMVAYADLILKSTEMMEALSPIFTSVVETSIQDDFHEMLAAMYNNAAGVHHYNKNFSSAEQYSLKAIALIEAMRPITPERKRSIAYFHANLGDTYFAQEMMTDARQCWEKALTLRSDLVQEVRSDKSRSELAVTMRKLAGLLTQTDEIPSAMKYIEDAIAIFDDLAKKTNTIQSRLDLGEAYHCRFEVYEAAGDYKNAIKSLIQEQGIYYFLKKETDLPQLHEANAVSHHCMGDTQAELEKPTLAIECYQTAAEEYLWMAENTKNIQFYHSAGELYFRMGQMQTATDPDKASACYASAVDVYEKLSKHTGNAADQTLMGLGLTRMAGIYEHNGKLTEAKECYQKATPIFEALEETAQSLNIRVQCYQNLGRILTALDEKPAALRCLLSCTGLVNKLDGHDIDPRVLERIAQCAGAAGDLLHEVGMDEDAVALFDLSVDLYTEYAEQHQTAESLFRLAMAQTKLGAASQDIECIEGALGMFRILCQIAPDDPSYQRAKQMAQHIWEMLNSDN